MLMKENENLYAEISGTRNYKSFLDRFRQASRYNMIYIDFFNSKNFSEIISIRSFQVFRMREKNEKIAYIDIFDFNIFY